MQQLQDDFVRHKTASMTSEKEKEAEIEKLRAKLSENGSGRNSASLSDYGNLVRKKEEQMANELEARVSQLTAALIAKQEQLESRTAEKNSLLIKIENLEVRIISPKIYPYLKLILPTACSSHTYAHTIPM